MTQKDVGSSVDSLWEADSKPFTVAQAIQLAIHLKQAHHAATKETNHLFNRVPINQPLIQQTSYRCF